MKKLALLVLLASSLLSSATVQAQFADTAFRQDIYRAGKSLRTYSRTMTAGYCVTLGGAALVLATAGNRSAAPVTGLGGILVVAGSIITMSAHGHVGKAGLYLQRNGLAIDVPRKKKKVRR